MRFVCQMNDGCFLNLEADRMEIREDHGMVLVLHGQRIVALVEMSAVVVAYLSEKGG